MITKDELIYKIQTEASVLGLDSFCLKLVELVQEAPEAKAIYTYAHLMQSVGTEDIERLQAAINYLKSSPIKLFSQQYQYVDDDGVVYFLDKEDLQAALADGALPHPDHGRLDFDFSNKVFIVYEADQAVISS